MVTTQNIMNWYDWQNVSMRFITDVFKIRKFQLDNLSLSRMVEEKREAIFKYILLSILSPRVR